MNERDERARRDAQRRRAIAARVDERAGRPPMLLAGAVPKATRTTTSAVAVDELAAKRLATSDARVRNAACPSAQDAAELVLRAERQRSDSTTKRDALDALKITTQRAAEHEKIAAIPDDAFEELISNAREEQREITTASALRVKAFPLTPTLDARALLANALAELGDDHDLAWTWVALTPPQAIARELAAHLETRVALAMVSASILALDAARVLLEQATPRTSEVPRRDRATKNATKKGP